MTFKKKVALRTIDHWFHGSLINSDILNIKFSSFSVSFPWDFLCSIGNVDFFAQSDANNLLSTNKSSQKLNPAAILSKEPLHLYLSNGSGLITNL